MKRLFSIVTALVMALQICGIGFTQADPAEVTVRFMNEDGEVLYEGTYSGDTLDLTDLDTCFPGLDAETLAAIRSATNIAIDGEGTGPKVVAEQNAEGKQISVQINGSIGGLEAAGDPAVVLVGDVDSPAGDGVNAGEEANITVDGSVQAYEDGVTAEDNAVVIVDGDINGGHTEPYTWTWTDSEGNLQSVTEDEAYGAGVIAEDNAVVVVEGDVSGQARGIETMNSSVVVVDGNVTAGEGAGILADATSYDEATETMVKEGNSSIVTVDGDVTSAGSGIAAYDSAVVEVTGSVTGTEYGGIYATNLGAAGEKIENKSQVTVGGDVTTSGEEGIMAEGSAQVTVEGSVTAGYMDEYTWTWKDSEGNEHTETEEDPIGTGVVASESASVKVGGDVESYNDGILTHQDADVRVDGDVTSLGSSGVNTSSVSFDYVTGEDVYGNSSTVKIGGNVTGAETGILASDKATVEVAGSVTGTEYGGIYAWNEIQDGNEIRNSSAVTVGGDVNAGEDGVHVEGSASVTVGGDVHAGQKGEDIPEQELWDTPTGRGVFATDNTTVNVQGSVDAYTQGIETTENATVSVGGNVTSQESAGIAAGYYSYDHFTEETTLGNSSVITVGGDVTGATVGIITTDKVTVEVGGDVTGQEYGGVYAWNNGYEETYLENQSKVTVGGNVSAGEDGVHAEGSADVFVGGDIHAGLRGEEIGEEELPGNPTGRGIYATENTSVTVNGSVESYTEGIETSGSAAVLVGGDVTSSTSSGIETDYSRFDYFNEETVPGNSSVVHVGGDVTGTSGILTSDQAKIEVEGSVTGTEYGGIYSWDYVSEGTPIENQSVVAVGGDVTAGEDGIHVEGSSSVTVGGDVHAGLKGEAIEEEELPGNPTGRGIYAVENTTVTVEGNVEAYTEGIETTENAVVTVGGDVTSKTAAAIETVDSRFDYNTEETVEGNESVITVGGSVSTDSGAAINMRGDPTITVRGDVTGGAAKEEESKEPAFSDEGVKEAFEKAEEETFGDVEETEAAQGAVQIFLDETDNDGSLIVGGTVSTGEGSVPIVINYTAEDADSLAEMPELPEMKIFEITPEDGKYFDVNVQVTRDVEFAYESPAEPGSEVQDRKTVTKTAALSEEEHNDLIEAIAAAIQYIIKINENEGSEIKLSADHYDAKNGIYTAHEEEDVEVRVSAKKGFNLLGLTATGNHTLKDNGDGTWTLIVHRGGGVILSAVISKREIEKPHPSVGRSVLFGRYDFDGDDEAEDLSWKILRVGGGYARLGLETGLEAIPEDFMTAFNEWETEQIRNGDISALDAGQAKSFFGDDLVHPSMYVKYDALNLD